MSANPENQIPRYMDISIDQVVPNDSNPRLVFPQEELDRLAESIDNQGIQVPVVVYQRNQEYVLVDGERRFKCALMLGLPSVPAMITEPRGESEQLKQMFNIHLIREPWQDIPTANALSKLERFMSSELGREPTDRELVESTGLSKERVQRLRYVVTLPLDWQDLISDQTIPLNFFWELKRAVIDKLKSTREDLLIQFPENKIMETFVQKRLDGSITDTVSLRKVGPVISYSAQLREEGGEAFKTVDNLLKGLLGPEDLTIDEVYEETVQLMVEIEKLERRAETVFSTFARLAFRAKDEEEIEKIKSIAKNLTTRLHGLFESNTSKEDSSAT